MVGLDVMGGIQGVLLGTIRDTGGEATAKCRARLLRAIGVKVTRRAYSVPVGGHLEFAGDATLTRAAVRLTDGTLGYSWVQGRDKQHAERCALIDALMQQSRHFQNLSETLIAPLDADRMARIAARQAEVNASRVDFFTMVRGDNA